MPRSYQYETPIVPHYPARSSSPRYSPSCHFTGWYITPERFANATHQPDHLSQAVALLKGNPVSFAEFVFIDYLCRDIQKMRQNLLDQEQVARQRLLQFFECKSTDELFDWMLEQKYARQQVIPRSDHTPPDSSSSSSRQSSQSRPLPKLPRFSRTPPIRIRTSLTITEACWCQWRREFLKEEFPEDPLKGTRENPIIVETTDFGVWIEDSTV